MKITTTVFFLLLISHFVIAQSLQTYDATLNVTGDLTLQHATAKVINISPDTMWIKASQDNLGAASGHIAYFCWGVTCYPPTVSISTTATMIAPGDTNSSFIGYLDPAGTTGVSVINYNFFNRDDVNDLVDISVTFDITTGIDELAGSVNLSNAFPNPANSMTSISYNLKNIKNASLVLTNILGSKLNQFSLSENQQTLIIPTTHLNSGIYFYSIVADGKILSTKKLIVAHK